MKKIIKQVTGDIVQITIADERWYVKSTKDGDKFVPSVTWIAGHYPKGIGFYKWLSNHSWDESEAIKQAAGDKGSKVHYAIGDLLDGKEVAMDSKYLNNTSGQEEELTLEEYDCLFAFSEWFKETKPQIIKKEFVVWNDKYNYAGTVDLLCKIGKEFWLIDFKTSQDVWPEYELQVSAYKHALGKKVKLGILQIGYRRNKHFWKFNEVEDKFKLFLSALSIWANENENVCPKKKDYPIKIQLDGNSKIDDQQDKPQAVRGAIRPNRKNRRAVQRKAGSVA